MLVDAELSSKLEEFNKYARFVSDKFGITVQFDGSKAQTDGNTILLPSIQGMTIAEIDFLYGILLHEVGHIRYTQFSEKVFEKIKSDNHFIIFNYIEDSRIENLLIEDFAGAEHIFSDLYHNVSYNSKLMNKIFGAKDNNRDLVWAGICTYCHWYRLDLSEKYPIKRIVNKTAVYNKVMEFVKVNKINDILDANLPDTESVVHQSQKILDLYFKGKDPSDLNLIKEQMKKLGVIKNDTLEKLKNKILKTMEKKKALTEEVKKLREEIQAQRGEQDLKEEELRKELASLKAEHKQSRESIKEYSKVNTKENKVRRAQDEVRSLEDRKKKLEQTLKDIVEKAKETTGKKASEKLQKKHEATEKRIDNIQQQIKEASDELKKAQSEADAVRSQAPSNPPSPMDLLANKQKQEKIQRQLRNMPESQAQKQYANKMDQLGRIANDMKCEARKVINSIKEDLEAAGIPSPFPGFVENPMWTEADDVQKDFDQKASSALDTDVNNGAGYTGTNIRDIVTFVDKTKNDIEEINLAEHFQKSHGMNRFDSFNDELSQITNTSETKVARHTKSSGIRKHIPSTTMFDTVVNKTTSDGAELSKIKEEKRDLIRRIKSIFKERFRFSKKIWYKGNQEDGQIDSRSVWKIAAGMNDPYLYEENHPKFVNKVSASILVDVSGSMDKSSTDYGKKLKELVFLISEGLTEVHIKHEILGFHAPVNHEMRSFGSNSTYNRRSNNLEHIVYKQINDRKNSGIQNMEIQCTDNSDGESIVFAAKRLLRAQGTGKILFIISDCKPFLSDGDLSALDESVKDSIEFCQKNKIQVFSVGFAKDEEGIYGKHFRLKECEDLVAAVKERF